MKFLASAVFFILGLSLWAEETPEVLLRTFRDGVGLTVPVWSDAMAESGRDRAQQLAILGVLSHQDGKGRSPGLQMISQGFAAGEFGEVLGAGRDLSSVWRAWLDSPTHRAVLTHPGWTRWGWGSRQQGQTTVWVLRFWKP